MGCGRVRTISFETIQPKLAVHHPRLATALSDILSAVKKGTPPVLYSARYRYGQLIVNRGLFAPPCSSTTCTECRALKENCGFGHIPLAVILNNSVEVFVEHESAGQQGRAESNDATVRTVPLRMLSDGDMFGTFETLDALMGQRDGIPPWSVAAGARSIWVLSPLGDRRLSETLAEGAGCDIDWNRGDSHWRLVQQVAHRENWEVELLFIGKGFLERVAARSPGSQNLFSLILETGWEQSRSLRNGTTFEASLRRWYLDGPAQSVASEFGEMYLYATVCHIFSISRGDLPAYRPAGSARRQYGPFMQFERQLHEALKVIKKDTGSKDTERKQAVAHYPVVVQPEHVEPGSAGFYSFRCPSLPGLRLPKVSNYAELPLPIKRTLDAASGYESHELDHAAVTYFAQAGRYDMHKPTSRFRWQEFLAHVEPDSELFRPDRLYYDSPFLVAGLRLVRRAGANAAAAR
jgi:hypothetical protein